MASISFPLQLFHKLYRQRIAECRNDFDVCRTHRVHIRRYGLTGMHRRAGTRVIRDTVIGQRVAPGSELSLALTTIE